VNRPHDFVKQITEVMKALQARDPFASAAERQEIRRRSRELTGTAHRYFRARRAQRAGSPIAGPRRPSD
jgi:hypothetical protein